MYISCCCRMNAPSFALHKCTLPLGSYQMREKCYYLWNKSTPTNYLIVFVFLFFGLGLVKRIKVQLGFFSIKLKCNKLFDGVFFSREKMHHNSHSFVMIEQIHLCLLWSKQMKQTKAKLVGRKKTIWFIYFDLFVLIMVRRLGNELQFPSWIQNENAILLLVEHNFTAKKVSRLCNYKLVTLSRYL